MAFVPKCTTPNVQLISTLKEYVYNAKRLLVMTGAGISTESGIPDYRSEKVGRYARTNHKPVQYVDFMRHARVRRRYWARNFVAWPKFSSTLPNITHTKLAEWESLSRISWLITQNVDYLHCKAGSERVTELHGNAYNVRCVQCGHHWPRSDFQQYMAELNSHWSGTSVEVAPDGDADLSPEAESDFNTPDCHKCGGIPKPEIVFFGENLRPADVKFCSSKMNDADALLVLGSSLQVLSGYRIVCQAFETIKPVLIVNIGYTRADPLATVKLPNKCSEVIRMIDEEWR